MSLQALPEEVDQLRPPIYGPYSYARAGLTGSSRVLDVGCGNAKVSAYLAESGALVDGIEPTASRAGIAAKRLRYVSTMFAGEDDPQLLDEYDVITFFDVIEHIADPEPVLAWAASKLARNGRIIASIPNSAHWTFRLRMLRGDWRMEDWGLFDRTHLHFYDPDTIAGLRPPGTIETDRRHFTPARRRIERMALLARPRLFALHVVLAWTREEG